MPFTKEISRRLTLARDHAGIKPLYYLVHPDHQGISFGSQYDVLFHTPWKKPTEINEEAFYLYLRLQHIPPPYGLFRSTFQLQPGSFLQISAEGALSKQNYWTLPRHVENNFIKIDEALPELDQTLQASVDRHRIADVPVGVFLSGGIDSPLITAIARHQVGNQLKLLRSAFLVGSRMKPATQHNMPIILALIIKSLRFQVMMF